MGQRVGERILVLNLMPVNGFTKFSVMKAGPRNECGEETNGVTDFRIHTTYFIVIRPSTAGDTLPSLRI